MNGPNVECLEFCPAARECDLAKKINLVGRDLLVRQIMSQMGMGVDHIHVNKGYYTGSGLLQGTEITDVEVEELARTLGGSKERIPKSDDPQERALSVLGKNHTDHGKLMVNADTANHLIRALREAQPECKGPRINFIGQIKELRLKLAIKGSSLGRAPFKRKHYERELQRVHIQNLRDRSKCHSRSARTATKALRKTPLMKKVRENVS